MKYFAHKDHSLGDHLNEVGKMAKEFARAFDGDGQGFVAGALHDLGKAEFEFQERLRTDEKEGKKEPHAHHGAAIALEAQAWPVAFAINGHHAGLHNRGDMGQKAPRFLGKAREAARKLTESDPSWVLPEIKEKLPEWLDRLPFGTVQERVAKMRAVEFYSRFLFSALIDADRLDTEANAPETKANHGKRNHWRFGEEALATDGAVAELLKLFEPAISERRKAAKDKGTSEDVLNAREKALQACQDAARNKPRGVFTLTMPTGGGKTLASIGFALGHIAAQNRKASENTKMRRVIIVIPYLNIIQQTAQELIKVFGHTDDNPVLLEHHSQAKDPELDEKKAKESGLCDYTRERTMRQLAAENWDAPMVVTTSVQFFDSLFSRKPADARKLHNIAQSVIIFDEVQTFPPRLMQPILDVLAELTSPQRPYGCSLVLCTATQPALGKTDDLPWGFNDVKEIIPDPEKMFKTLRRTVYPELEGGGGIPSRSWPNLANEVFDAPHKQALVVVNTRRHARELFQELRKSAQYKDSIFHLSTWMTPAHRMIVLTEVSRRLEHNEPCFLVSTQCIEAGVDVDFPAVWRAFGPYDAIVQAAGRCNRGGRLKPCEAKVHVFRPEEDNLPPGVYQTASSQTELLMKMSAADPHDPASFQTYFRLLYQLSVPDECEIQRDREQLRFEAVSDSFNFIESDNTVPLLILRETVDGQKKSTGAQAIFDAAKERDIRGREAKGYFTRDDWRRIQPYVLNLDWRSKGVKEALATYAPERIFDSDLRIWGAGDAGYLGGLHGIGIEFQPDFSKLLQDAL